MQRQEDSFGGPRSCGQGPFGARRLAPLAVAAAMACTAAQAGTLAFSAADLALLAASPASLLRQGDFFLGVDRYWPSLYGEAVAPSDAGMRLIPNAYPWAGSVAFTFSQPVYDIQFSYSDLTGRRWGTAAWQVDKTAFQLGIASACSDSYYCALAGRSPGSQPEFNALSNLGRTYLTHTPGATTGISSEVSQYQVVSPVPASHLVDSTYRSAGTVRYSAADAAQGPVAALALHSYFQGTDGFVLDSLTVKTAVPLYFDFGTDLDHYISTMPNKDPLKADSIIITAADAANGKVNRAAAIAYESQKKMIVEYAQAIFDRSGIPVYVTTQKPAEPALTVRFVQALPDYKVNAGAPGTGIGTLEGIAYDVAPRGLFQAVGSDVDHQDVRKDGTVAVFVKPQANLGEAELLSLAQTAVHEAGHGWGLVHVGDPSRPQEVMDYVADPLETFSQVALPRTDPEATGDSNPAYYLRRYLLGQTDEEIGLQPGSYDTQSLSFAQHLASGVRFAADWAGLNVRKVFAQPDGEANLGGAAGALVLLAENVHSGSTFDFRSAAGAGFTLLGSTDGQSLDVVFSLDGAGGQQQILLWDPDWGSYRQVGVFNFSSSAVAAVPEPSAALLLLAGGAVVALAGRVRRPRPR